MSSCPNCDLPITAAPWRYDDAEHGVHWVCPTDERIQSGVIYAPVSLAQAINDYLKRNNRHDLIGVAKDDDVRSWDRAPEYAEWE